MKVNHFDNGILFPNVLWDIWNNTKSLQLEYPEPYKTNKENSFLKMLNEMDESFAINIGEHLGIKFNKNKNKNKNNLLVTGLAMGIYYLRSDLQKRFPEPMSRNRRPFAKWFVDNAESEYKLDPIFVDPMRMSLKKFSNPLKYLLDCFINWIENKIYEIYKSGIEKNKAYSKFENYISRSVIGRFLEKVITIKLSEKNYAIPTVETVKNLKNICIDEKPYGVNVIGYLRTPDALGTHARGIIDVLIKAKIPVAYVNIPDHPDYEKDYDFMNQIPQGTPYAINLVYTAATQLYLHDLLGEDLFRNHYNIGFLWGDSGHFPQSWQHACGIYHEIWVGSKFVQDMLTPISTQPIHFMPLVTTIPGQAVYSRADLGLPEDKHIFLFVFDTFSSLERKNPQAVINAYRLAFTDNFENTCLVIKAMRLEIFPEAIEQLQNDLNEVGGILINKIVTKNELTSLYHACDTYISLHRAEGYGATLAEAMLLGKPVIATGYSGNMDFMTRDNSYPISYDLVKLEKNVGMLSKGSIWAEANIADAARAMRRVVENPDEAQLKADLAKKYIQDHYSPNVVATKMKKRLSDIYIHIKR